MDERELLQELYDFVNEHGLWTRFMEWEEERGFSTNELERDFDNILE